MVVSVVSHVEEREELRKVLLVIKPSNRIVSHVQKLNTFQHSP